MPTRSLAPASVCSTRPSSTVTSIDGVARVEVRGNARTPLATICAGLGTRAGDAYDERRIAHDVTWLSDSGLLDDVSVSRARSPQGTTVTFVFRERPRVSSVAFRGVAKGDPDHLRALLTLAGAKTPSATSKVRATSLPGSVSMRGWSVAWT